MASTSCAFFMEPAPVMPRPPAIALRSASSMELSPPPRFFAGAADASGGSEWWIRWFPSREVLPTYQCRSRLAPSAFWSCGFLGRSGSHAGVRRSRICAAVSDPRGIEEEWAPAI